MGSHIWIILCIQQSLWHSFVHQRKGLMSYWQKATLSATGIKMDGDSALVQHSHTSLCTYDSRSQT